MAQGKKFGTFGGVFTPSILTILGVIMYLRLPWIVGQAGIFLTIGIVIIAHFVSIATGLSVSSIATDKKVKAGGTYFIISRSLGLPIGGTLGIALFFGLSFSVSLYIIGFSESFLGFWDIPITKDAIRLTGTIAIILVGILTFISTSLAIKTQFFIMAAIALSLVSIIFGKTDFVPAEPILNPISTVAPLILLFAIFFPAVTGFEAGVSMSGDLKDPKKSIPIGTISAIFVGLVAYIGLAIFFGYRVNSDALVNNPNILLEISFYAPIVVAGIWGATLSSAIGSILGAPRILQATSLDRITPKIFAKGYGKSNEPRNAHILTFIVAEAGILIGELNLIARVVSMFFITTYGFLNLSSALERWASTDFRPSFKIPAWISVFGALVCFILMMELDFIALIGATIIMGLIFLYLKRKELTLESGDTWEGVWSSILRSGLNRISRTEKQQRNWRPNIILFSGDGSARPHLLEFGRWLVYKRGILSNFNLIENPDTKHLIPLPALPVKKDDNDFQGIFMRQMEVNDIYEGMDTITKVYGFAGLEPNSVMLGWARNTKQPDKFGQLICNYSKLDYNIFIMDFDSEHGFGAKQNIDIWWRGGSNNMALALTMLKFLQASDEWDDAQARIFIVNEDSSLYNKIYKNMTALLEEQRIDATVKIINNAIDHKPVKEIIKIESMDADLVILGLPEVNQEKSSSLINEMDEIIHDLKTVLLIAASSFFKPVFIGIEKKTIKAPENISSVDTLKIISPQLELPSHEVLSAKLSDIDDQAKQIFSEFQQDALQNIYRINIKLIDDFNNLISKSFKDSEEILSFKEARNSRKTINHVQSSFLFNLKKLILEFKNETIADQKEYLVSGIQLLLDGLENLHNTIPAEIIVYFDRKDTDKKHLFRSKKPVKRKIRLQSIFAYSRKVLERKVIYQHLRDFGISSYQLNSELQKLFNNMNDSILAYESAILNNSLNKKVFDEEKHKVEHRWDHIKYLLQSNFQGMLDELFLGLNHAMQSMSNDLSVPENKSKLNKKIKIVKKQAPLSAKIMAAPEYWKNNLELITNFFIEDLHLKSIRNRIETIIERMLAEIMLTIDTNYISPLNDFYDSLAKFNESVPEKVSWSPIQEDLINAQSIFSALSKDIQAALDELPEDLEVMAEESFQNLEKEQFNNVNTVSVNLHRYIDFITETDLIEPLQRFLNEKISDLARANDFAQEIVRFINYNLSLENDNPAVLKDTLTSIIVSAGERLHGRIKSLDDTRIDIQKYFHKQTNALFEKMNPILVTRAVGELKHTIRTKESLKYLDKIKSYPQKVKSVFKNILVRLVYQRSEGLLFAKKFGRLDESYQTGTGNILETIQNIAPSRTVERSLPFYYRQLFLNKRTLNKEFLIERPSEMDQAARAINLYQQGHHGALLIIGEPFSGKSTLSNTIAQKHFEKSKIYHLYPPDGGSAEIVVLKKQLSETLQTTGNIDEIFDNLTGKSVIILHDLEMWWQRSIEGFKVIDKLTELINKYSSKCFFIINCSRDSYHFINRIKPIEELFIRALECKSFDAEDIQEAILLRHQASGMKFQLETTPEERLSNLKMARLFNSYFDISKGNIGRALYYWLSNIQKVTQDTLEMRYPVKINMDVLNNLNKDWIVWLQQFILHKQLTIQRLMQISMQQEADILAILHTLKRSAIIVEDHNNILSINPYIQPVIVSRFREMGLL